VHHKKTYKEGVSVVIVTYNGSDRIVKTLEYLSRQEAIDFDIELILVDNNSSDQTVESAKFSWKKLGAPFPLRAVTELQQGTMYARKRGAAASQYRYMLYCDDDNWLELKYIMTAYQSIIENEQIAAVGGQGIIELDDEIVVPSWINKFERSYGVGSQGSVTGDITFKKGCLYTAGTILDLAWLDKLYDMGFKSSLKGRDSKTLVAGEDTELTYALKLIGGKIHYNSGMQFKHYMPAARINWKYLRKLWWAFGYAEFVISPYNFYFTNKRAPHFYFLILRVMIKLIIRYSKNVIKGNKEGDYGDLKIMRLKGELSACLKEGCSYKSNIRMIHLLTNNK
jgi:glycosyltransferase involved in cell wall biosynthesis